MRYWSALENYGAPHRCTRTPFVFDYAVPEPWSPGETELLGRTLGAVGVHEIGHALGLVHADVGSLPLDACERGVLPYTRMMTAAADCARIEPGSRILYGPDFFRHPMLSESGIGRVGDTSCGGSMIPPSGRNGSVWFYRPSVSGVRIDAAGRRIREPLFAAPVGDLDLRGGRVFYVPITTPCSGVRVDERRGALEYLRQQYGLSAGR